MSSSLLKRLTRTIRIPRLLRDAVLRVCRAETVLEPWQRRQYERDGFLVIDPRVPMELLDCIRDETCPHYPSQPPGGPGYPLCGRVQDAWKFSTAVKALARAEVVLAALHELYGREPLPFQTLNFPVGTQQAVHSDTIHFNSKPAGWMCGVWVALEDMDMDNGPLVYYPGSHKLKEYDLDDVGVS